MTRIVAGVAGGRRITVPRTFRGRPTSERAREGLFATLTAMLGDFEGLRFLDAYAGTGAVGIEALSRGADHALLVESDRAAARSVERHAREFGLRGAVVLARPVERVVAGTPMGGPYDVVFLDPPYPTGTAEVVAVLETMGERGWLAPDAVVVVERASREPAFPWPAGIVADRSRRYGEATLWYGRDARGERGHAQ